MKLKIKFNDKERHILYRVLAVVLLLSLCIIFIGFNAYIIDKWNVPNWIAILTGLFWWAFAIPVWRHYG